MTGLYCLEYLPLSLANFLIFFYFLHNSQVKQPKIDLIELFNQIKLKLHNIEHIDILGS